MLYITTITQIVLCEIGLLAVLSLESDCPPRNHSSHLFQVEVDIQMLLRLRCCCRLPKACLIPLAYALAIPQRSYASPPPTENHSSISVLLIPLVQLHDIGAVSFLISGILRKIHDKDLALRDQRSASLAGVLGIPPISPYHSYLVRTPFHFISRRDCGFCLFRGYLQFHFNQIRRSLRVATPVLASMALHDWLLGS